MIQDNLNLNEDWVKKKSGMEREQNESFERELRPWNAPVPIDEMEFQPKSQESDKHKKDKGNEKANEKRVQEGRRDLRKHLHSEHSALCNRMI